MDVTTMLGIAVIAVFCLLWLGALAKRLYDFFDERAYIVRQIRKSDTERGKAHWKRKLHEFYLCSIPFVGKWFKNRRI